MTKNINGGPGMVEEEAEVAAGTNQRLAALSRDPRQLAMLVQSVCLDDANFAACATYFVGPDAVGLGLVWFARYR